MSFQVVLIGKRNEETVALKGQLAKRKDFNVELVSIADKALQRLTSDRTDLVVFNFELFTKEKIRLATDLRSLGYEFPVLVLSRIISADSYEALQQMNHTILLEKPFEQKDMWGLCDKLIQKRPVNQRVHRRFYTNQKAAIDSYSGGNAKEAKVYNLSRGGAYLEGEGLTFKKGEIVRVNVSLNEVYRQYNVDAKVIWTAKEGLWGNGKGVGVEFIKAKDVYRHLLSKM